MAVQFNYAGLRVDEGEDVTYFERVPDACTDDTCPFLDWSKYPMSGHRCEWSEATPEDLANEATEASWQRAFESGRCDGEALWAATSERYGGTEFLCAKHTLLAIADWQAEGAEFHGAVTIEEY